MVGALEEFWLRGFRLKLTAFFLIFLGACSKHALINALAIRVDSFLMENSKLVLENACLQKRWKIKNPRILERRYYMTICFWQINIFEYMVDTYCKIKFILSKINVGIQKR